MKRLLILVLAMLCMLSACGQGGTKTPSKDSSGASNVSSQNDKDADKNDEQSDTADSSGDTNAGAENSATNYKGTLKGTVTTTNNNAEEVEVEIIPSADDAYKLNPMIGGSDTEAKKLRNEILATKDTLNVSGKKYYVSSANGSDSNDGLSPETPFKTLDKVSSTMLYAGDGVFLERNSIFRLTSSFSCKSGVTYGAYGSGNKPAIYGSVMNFAKNYLWSPSSIKNVWEINFPFNGDVGIIVFNHGEHASNRTDFIRLLEKNGDFYVDDSTGTMYLYCDKGNPGLKYYSIEIGTRMVLFNLPSYSGENITIDNICFKYSGNFAIRGSVNLKNITVTNCEIGWIGGALQPDGSNVYGNGIEFLGGIQGACVKNNWFYQIFDSAVTFQAYSDNYGYDVIYKNIDFSNNLMEYCGMSGIEWWARTGDIKGTIDDCVIENILFSKNIMRFTGYGWVKNGIRGARHIQGPWNSYTYTAMKNFVVCDNVFDCALGGVYSFPYYTKPTQEQHSMYGNIYYQKATPTNVANVFGETAYATNQTEFEAAIKAMESSPKLIKWLE